MKRLNVPCDSGGYLIFSDQNILCGKLEDLALGERIYYFPLHHNTSIILHKNPLFSLNYKLVDYCYNVTLTAHNSSMLLEPKYDLECFFKIHLPYGNQIELNLFTNFYTKSPINGSILEKSKLTIAADDIDYEYIDLTSTQYITNDDICTGINVRIDDLNAKNWTHCIRGDSLAKKFTFKSVGNSILVHISKIVYDNAMIIDSETDLYDGPPSIYLEYNALPIPEIVSQCAFGWIAIHQFCITAIETALPWKQAESECEKYGGHLASIKSEREQKLIDTLLMNRLVLFYSFSFPFCCEYLMMMELSFCSLPVLALKIALLIGSVHRMKYLKVIFVGQTDFHIHFRIGFQVGWNTITIINNQTMMVRLIH